MAGDDARRVSTSDDSIPPDDVALAEAAAIWRGAYVHVPFCARVCPYCDFAVVAGRDDLADEYVTTVRAEIAMEPEWGPIDALHVGGGTPSQLPPGDLAEIVGALDARFGLSPGAELAIEANPEDWTEAFAAAVVAAGFDRVSLGAQSFDGEVLAALGRAHGPDDVAAAVRAARSAGCRSVGLDLIFGAPEESSDSWRRTLEAAIALSPDHVSAYALTVERGTPLGRAVAAGAPAPDPDVQADRYELAERMLGEAGLVRYEVSNHARPGHHSRYNLLTWAGGEYLAFGNGAHGHRDGVRRRNHRRPEAYLAAVAAGRRPEAGTEQLDGWEKDRELVMLGIRRSAGVEAASPVVTALLAGDWGHRLLDAGVLAVTGGRLRVARPLLTDDVGRALLALSPDDC